MERLTKRNSHGSVMVSYSKIKWSDKKDCVSTSTDVIVNLAYRLAEYEDRNLTPEQIDLLIEEHKHR